MVQLVKLGGSVITEKAGGKQIRSKVLERLAHEIAKAQGEVVVVHGAGSFGHPLAQEAGLVDGIADADGVKAAAEVHADVRRLDVAVLDALSGAGLAPVSLPPFGTLGCSDGRTGAWNMVPFRRALDLGLTPVTFGDLVLDTTRGMTVVSGDRLMVELARFLETDRAIFALAEDGVYTHPPDHDEATLLEQPTLAELGEADAVEHPEQGADVTGAMAAKVAAAGTLVAHGTTVHFVNGLEEGRLAAALAGEDVTGTLIRPEVTT